MKVVVRKLQTVCPLCKEKLYTKSISSSPKLGICLNDICPVKEVNMEALGLCDDHVLSDTDPQWD